jgi:hypothetical protein
MSLNCKMSPERLVKLRRLELDVQEAQQRLVAYQEDLKAEAPVKIGDDVKVTGYSFRGKTMRVFHIALHKGYKDRYSWKARGFVLNKDGTPGARTGETEWEIEE